MCLQPRIDGMDLKRGFGAASCGAAGLSVALLLVAFLDRILVADLVRSQLPLVVWAACAAMAAASALLVALLVDAERETTYGGWLLTLVTVAFLVFGAVGFG